MPNAYVQPPPGRPRASSSPTTPLSHNLPPTTLWHFRQPNKSASIDVHYADAVRAKTALDFLMDDLCQGKEGLWVRSVPVKTKDAIKRKATNDYGGEIRR